MTTAPVMAKLAEARARGATKVAFGGGEPTIRREPPAAGALVPRSRLPLDQDPVERLDVLVSLVRRGGRATRGSTDFHISFMAHTDGALRADHGHARTRFDARDAGRAQSGGARSQAGRRPDHQERHLDAPRRHRRALGRLGHRDVQPVAGVAVATATRTTSPRCCRSSRCATASCAAFERGRQLGVTVRSRHIPRCMLPGYEEHVADLREDKVLVVTPRATLRALGIDDLAQHVRREVQRLPVPARRLPRRAHTTTSSATATRSCGPRRPSSSRQRRRFDPEDASAKAGDARAETC